MIFYSVIIKMKPIFSIVLFVVYYISCINCYYYENKSVSFVERKYIVKRALEKTHEKPLNEKWMDKFHGKYYKNEETVSLVNLIYMITKKYLSKCIPIVLYERKVKKENYITFKQLFKKFPTTFIHGEIGPRGVDKKLIGLVPGKCKTYVLFLSDVMNCQNVFKKQSTDMVLVASWSSQWRVQEFLSSSASQKYVNLLVIGQSIENKMYSQATFILYTHKLYVDGLGSSIPVVLTSWANGSLVQKNVNLFPPKMKRGFAGHRFIISLAHQPPFVIKKRVQDNDGSNARIEWDGLELRVMKLLSHMLNFTIEYREVNLLGLGSAEAVVQEVAKGRADVGIGGIYVTNERIAMVDLTHGHSQDCASFISLMSTALPRYRAIMGPFQWTVWLALTVTYMIAIFPLAFSDRHTFSHLINNPGEIENMFWYVFGTFTNCFTFTGIKSWSKSKKIATRLLVGWYWGFTIIITACYTGSIIAFVTVPVYPATIDTTDQLLGGRFRIGTLDKGGWHHWFSNSTDETVNRLLKNVDLVPDVESGVRNVTRAFFWPYSFLASRAELDFIVKMNFTRMKNKRSLLHISSECFVPYMVSFALPIGSMYETELNTALLRIVQSGFIKKILNDIKWENYRSPTGNLLQANSDYLLRDQTQDDKALSLDDTQGMFLLLGIGFLIAGGSLFSEYIGGCFNYCQRRGFFRKRPASETSSDSRSYDSTTSLRRRKSKDTVYSPGKGRIWSSKSCRSDGDLIFPNSPIENNNEHKLSVPSINEYQNQHRRRDSYCDVVSKNKLREFSISVKSNSPCPSILLHNSLEEQVDKVDSITHPINIVINNDVDYDENDTENVDKEIIMNNDNHEDGTKIFNPDLLFGETNNIVEKEPEILNTS